MKHSKECIVIDTEFNSCDYESQNGGIQEIVQVGAVYMQNGKIRDMFSRYCLLAPGHRLSESFMGLTGIQPRKVKERGLPFLEVMDGLDAFRKKHGLQAMYAFGTADAVELRHTAKLNHAGMQVYRMIRDIRDVYPVFEKRLGLKYSFSLADLCRICGVPHDKAHSAVFDAKDTAKALYNLAHGKADMKLLAELTEKKEQAGRERMEAQRRAQMAAREAVPGTNK